MAEPTLENVYTSNWADVTANNESVTGIAWSEGDLVVVLQGAESGFSDGSWIVPLDPPTNANLTFSELALEINDGDENDCYVGAFAAIAGSSQTNQTITSATPGAGNATAMRGMRVLVYSGSDGVGATNSIDNSSAKTISLTRTGANSHVACILWDWNAVNDVTVDATPTGTVQNATNVSEKATGFCCTFGDQGAAGTTSYGITNHTGTVVMSGIAVEILGVAAAGATPRGNLLLTGVGY